MGVSTVEVLNESLLGLGHRTIHESVLTRTGKSTVMGFIHEEKKTFYFVHCPIFDLYKRIFSHVFLKGVSDFSLINKKYKKQAHHLRKKKADENELNFLKTMCEYNSKSLFFFYSLHMQRCFIGELKRKNNESN